MRDSFTLASSGPKVLGLRRVRRLTPIHWLILCGAVLITMIGIGTGLITYQFRNRAIESSKRDLQNQVLLIARHFDQELSDLQGVQNDIMLYMQAEHISSADVYRKQMSSMAVHQMMRAKLSALPYIGGVNLLDADGQLINSSEAWPVPNINVADRNFFKQLKDGTANVPVLLEPVISRVTGAWTAVFARKVVGPNGEFLGVICRGVEPSHFESFFGSLMLAPHEAISMIHEKGIVLAHYPRNDKVIGLDVSDSSLFKSLIQKGDEATGQYISPINGQDQLASVRRLASFPIFIVSTTAMSAALAEWQEQTKFQLIGTAISAIIIATILLSIIKQLNRQHSAAQSMLTEKSQHLHTAINTITQGLVLFNANARLVVCNQRFIDMLKLSPDVVKPGCHFRELVAHRKQTGSFAGDVDEYCTTFLRNVAASKVNDAVLSGPDGRLIQIVYQQSNDGGWASTLEDITERRQSEARIAHLAHHDALTDLPNRVMFHEYVERLVTGLSNGRRFAVLYIDIDQFKSINDSLGHAIGDELLKEVAVRLRGCLRSGDFVARLGGDEFAIVQTKIATKEDVNKLVVRLYSSLRQHFDCLGHRLTTDASIGIAMAPDDGTNLEQLLKRADLAMYSAKSEGRRRHRFFEGEMELRATERHMLEQELRDALKVGGFEVHYQPLVDLQTNEVSGCEALVRWRHPTRGLVSPAEFIPVAEETGLIVALGNWVLKTACAEAATWPDRIVVAVNVSPVQFNSSTFVLNVIGALAASNLRADRLELEITEAVLISDDEAALSVLHQLRSIGVRIALDDFGTGYSSLSYLQRFPFDKIKIDRSFIKDICGPDGSSSIVQAVVNIATARDMLTTAEGVETREQMELLQKLGCSQMQGYLFSPAVTASKIGPLIGKRPDMRSSAV